MSTPRKRTRKAAATTIKVRLPTGVIEVLEDIGSLAELPLESVAKVLLCAGVLSAVASLPGKKLQAKIPR